MKVLHFGLQEVDEPRQAAITRHWDDDAEIVRSPIIDDVAAMIDEIRVTQPDVVLFDRVVPTIRDTITAQVNTPCFKPYGTFESNKGHRDLKFVFIDYVPC